MLEAWVGGVLVTGSKSWSFEGVITFRNHQHVLHLCLLKY